MPLLRASLFTGLFGLALVSPASLMAQGITDLGLTDITFGGTQTYNVNLNSSQAFVAYPFENSQGVTDGNDLAIFTNLTDSYGYYAGSNNSCITVTYTGGSLVGFAGAGNQSTSANPGFTVTGGFNDQESVSLFSTLFAESEEFSIYADAFNAKSTFSISLYDSSANLLASYTTPTTGLFGREGNGNPGNGHSYALQQFVVTGAAVGDFVQITDTTTANGGYANVGFNAVTANAVVPEPSVFAILLSGLGGLCFFRRNRRGH